MAMEEDLVARLAAQTAISDITGSRISFFSRQRGDTAGQIVLSIVTPGREWTHGGPDWLDRPRVRFDLYHSDSNTLITLRDAVIAEMETASTDGATVFHEAMLEASRSADLGELEGGDDLFQWQLEFLFFHEETT